ncbi:ribosome hibernation-promoting factor, HPF/YfiA family [Aureivirga sp. CE67]|uniref:ribosome hibernation-promoting factor, HPF/YfiA family n=1 Tax=Aureivirga sp. CE67 TaxID=1788983 RepID=UPI0018CA0D2B|nr:ribosome-associated translation inhibitor RaiA [Aureivirga sp. CE67]
MKILFQSVNFNADKDLVAFIEKKVEGLEKFYDKIIDAEVFLKVQQTSEKENKVAEIKVNVPGDEMIVKKQSKSFEEGAALCVDALKRQLEKHKERQRGTHV